MKGKNVYYSESRIWDNYCNILNFQQGQWKKSKDAFWSHAYLGVTLGTSLDLSSCQFPISQRKILIPAWSTMSVGDLQTGWCPEMALELMQETKFI